MGPRTPASASNVADAEGAGKEGAMAREVVHIGEPRFTRWLFASSSGAWIWLVVRLYLGYEWAHAGYEKVFQDHWLSTTEPLKGFVGFALQGAGTGAHSAVNYGWYAAFLRWVGGDGAGIMSRTVAIGELVIGIALILGLFTGIAAFFGGMLSMSFGLAGVAGVNPAFFLLEVLLVLAWRNAGYIGLDRWVLPAVGTPWEPGTLFETEKEMGTTRQLA
jgi:thiosulfate dehydrogenase [quinone] large subunit